MTTAWQDNLLVPGWSSDLSNRAALPRPGPVFGAYPLRAPMLRSRSPLLAWCQAAWSAPGKPSSSIDKQLLHGARIAQKKWARLSDRERDIQQATLRVQLGTSGFTPQLTAQSFGLIGWAIRQHLGFELHDVQILAAWWMLGQRLIEMATGEGKTLTVLLTAATAALAGVPVHVLTANDYLARRDAQHLMPIYESLGLGAGWVTAASTPPERHQAYQADIVHVTAKEVAFDHLRDRAAKAVGDAASMVLRGLCMAVVDEADSILIDEACTPLVLARAIDQREADQRYRLALFLARQLKEGSDFVCHEGLRVSLTAAGSERLGTLARSMDGPWRLKRYRDEQVGLALSALHVFKRDVHYLVRDKAIHIVDETTGRLAQGRAWSRGLHQMVAIKEALPPQMENETLTQTTFQAFFPRYHRLAGLSGTVLEDHAELMRVYRLPVVRVPLRLKSQRQTRATLVVPSATEKWARVVERARQAAAKGRPVLIGTDTVADSDALSRAFQAQGVPHQLLNARQDGATGEEELAVVAQAGLAGRITVATHMAGRGTDIQLSPEALAQGGLHVINTNLNRSPRIDRQLYGRCARQGTPGSAECILSWEDGSWREAPSGGWLGQALGLARRGWGGQVLARWVCAQAQRHAQGLARQRRWYLLLSESQMARQLALAGSQEWD